MTDLTSLVPSGSLLISGQTLGEPVALLDHLFDTMSPSLELTLFTGMSLTDVLTRAPSGVQMSSFVGLGTNRDLVDQGRMQLIPMHMSDLPPAISGGALRPDVALVLVSPPDEQGMCSLGVTSDYIWSAASAARVVLAEVNDCVPRIAGDTMLPFDRFDATITANRPLPEQSRVAPSDRERLIAARVATLVADGSCIQIGVGRLGEAVLEAIGGRRDLGVHSGMVGDTVLEMMRDGVITNACKFHDEGITVAGSILGSGHGVALAARQPNLRLRSVTYTHDPGVIGALDRFVCINSALEVDLLGQVNSEVAGGRYVGAIGGAVDYLRGAARSSRGRSVVALPATAGSASRIVPTVQRVTALRADVDAVVTEYGVAELRGATQGQRVGRLVDVAAPEHRDELRRAASDIGL